MASLTENASFVDASRCMANASSDNLFGPVVHNCRSDFDFTLLFEQSILSIVPSALLILFLPQRLWRLLGESSKAHYNGIAIIKQSLYALLFAAQLATLVFSVLPAAPSIKTVVPSQVMAVAIVIGMSGLSFLEHIRSPRSSDGINVYLFFSIMFDAVQVRTLWLRLDSLKLAVAASVCLALKVVLLTAEAQSKKAFLFDKYRVLAPETLSGVFARRCFWWLNKLLIQGYKVLIRPDQLIPIKEDFASSELLESIDHIYTRGSPKNRGLLKASLQALAPSVLAPVLPRLALVVLRYAQPFLFQSIISFVQKPRSERSRNEGYGLIAATGLLYLGLAVSLTYYQHKTYQLVTRLRGALVSLLYAKTLKSPPQSLGERAPVTLMSVDVDGITMAAPTIHELWASLVETGVAIWLLQRQVGYMCVVPLSILLICTTTAVWTAKKMSVKQATWNQATQERITATSSILSSIKSIKLMGFAKHVVSDIRGLREAEISKSRKFRKFTVMINALGNLPLFSAPVATFAVFTVLPQSKFTITMAFTSLTLVSLLQQSAIAFIGSLPPIAGSLGCFGRLETFLESVDSTDQSSTPPRAGTSTEDGLNSDKGEYEKVGSKHDAPLFKISDATFKTTKEANFRLQNINLTILSSSFVGITGPSGCGKTLLIKALLKRLPCTDGACIIPDNPIAYCSQTPWLCNETIKDTVVGQTTFDEIWYKRVMNACALDQDLESMQEGDQSVIGSQGGTLSGGQKQRLALARAVYSRIAIVILDDIFSGMDSRTTSHICNALFSTKGIFRELKTTVVLATHAGNALGFMDNVITMTTNGQIASFGHHGHSSEYASDITDNEAQITPAKPSSPPKQTVVTVSPTPNPEQATKDSKRQTGDWRLYHHYILSIKWWRFAILLIVHVGDSIMVNFPTVWLKQWSESEERNPKAKTSYYLGVYGAISALGIILIVVIIWFMFLVLVPASGRALHSDLLNTVINAKQELHDTVDAGVTLNRFAQDMQHVDRDLPSSIMRTMSASFSALASATLVCIGSSYIAAFLPFLLVTLYCLQRFYLRTSRQLRLLEIESRSPLYSIFQEMSEGLDTILSFRWQVPFQSKLFELLDSSQKPYYLLFCVQRWLILVLGFMVAGMAVLLVAFSLEVGSSSSGGAIGVGLIAILGFNDSMKFLIIEWTTLETSLGAIARLKEFSQDTPMEEDEGRADEEEEDVNENWPEQGEIKFMHAEAKYRSDLPAAFSDVSFTIPAGSKFGICGRTGSGKSSLLSSLFRLLDLSSGSILIDGIPHTKIPLATLRSRIVVLPQQPYLLSGSSIRRNMDPQGRATDGDIKAALDKVGLWHVVSSSSSSSSGETSDSATSLSVRDLKVELDQTLPTEGLSPGQRQLFVLSRSLLTLPRPKILVLDEVTSNLDTGNDALMQRLIREEFADKGCTVVAIAHRLESLLDFDVVVVMDSGQMVECGSPTKGEIFKGMMRAQSQGRD